MAGLYDRIKSAGLDPENQQRIHVEQGWRGIIGVYLDLWTADQARDVLNAELARNNAAPLRAEDETDLTNIINVLAGKSNLSQQYAYIEKLKCTFTAATIDAVSESKFRTDLEIP